MSLALFLDNLFIQPLMVIYTHLLLKALGLEFGPGWALVAFSLILNLAISPIYYQMERVGRATARSREAMDKEITRIKAHYRGRERYFYIRTIHRQFGYRPISAILASGDLFLQMLVFASVYRFLSSQTVFVGAEFLAIRDLSRPDRLLGGLNLLPLLMTVVNILSVRVHTGEASTRRTANLLALLFLVLLYRSPAALALYWTCNNTFSLVRNLLDRRLIPALPRGLTGFVSRVAAQE